MTEEIVLRMSHIVKEYKLYNSKADRIREIVNLTGKQYHKLFLALNDVSFEVCEGETVGIIGTNGSGKSTLLKILTGVVSQTSGTVEVHGKISSLLELGAGFNPEYTGMQNIYLNGTMMGFSKAEMDGRVEQILGFADIGEFVYQPVKTYSSGMFARLAFAVAINVDPDILVVDEALSVGDVFFQNKCFRKFEELEKKGTTILFVSHDIETVKKMCSRVLWIERGVQKMFGPSREVCNAYAASILQKNNKTAQTDGNLQDTYKRNLLELSDYPAITEYGKESILSDEVKICSFHFEDQKGNPIYTLEGGVRYKLVVMFYSRIKLENVIVGFVLQTKKGLILINSNSLVTGNKSVFSVEANTMNRAEFSLVLPYFASDEYILDCAVAQGTTVNSSKMLSWLYGALRVFINNPLGDLGIVDVDADVKIYYGKEKERR